MQQANQIEKDIQCIDCDGKAEFIVFDFKQINDSKLLCKKCYLEKNKENLKALTLEEFLKVKEKQSDVQNNIVSQMDKLYKLVNSAKDFRSQFLTFFDNFIFLLEDWNQTLLIFNKNQNLSQELSYLEQQSITLYEKQFMSSNYIYLTKLCNRFKEYNLVYLKEQKQFQILLTNLMMETQTIVPDQDTDIDLKIDSQEPQQDCCLNIAFNPSNSIMVSTKIFNIQTWRFEKGKINYLQNLNTHKDWVNCIVYSKQQEVFFSGSDDKTIIIWKYQNNQWISSKPFQKHIVYCLLLNSKEDYLFSGGGSNQIVVWKVNLEQNELIYQYELEKHKSCVFSMSLNQSENTLVSCANQKHQIIIWGTGQDNKLKFKYLVKQQQSYDYYGKKLFFISENCFIWVTATKEVDKIFVFEAKNGVFQEKTEKTIELNQDKENEDMFLFPIIKHQQSQCIIVRHKTHIYFLKDLGSGKLKIIDKIDCYTTNIYGTITNNLSHLLFWDNKILGYSIYEIKLTERFNNR